MVDFNQGPVRVECGHCEVCEAPGLPLRPVQLRVWRKTGYLADGILRVRDNSSPAAGAPSDAIAKQ